MAELRDKVGNLSTGDEARLIFAEVAQRWLNLSRPTMKPRSFLRKSQFVDQLTKVFAGMPIRNIAPIPTANRWPELKSVALWH